VHDLLFRDYLWIVRASLYLTMRISDMYLNTAAFFTTSYYFC
jgi:hypothetical protein